MENGWPMSMLLDGSAMSGIPLKHKIVLASASPRRKELLAGLGIEFSVRVIDGIDESWPEGLDGPDIPVYISRNKARAYRAGLMEDELVIAADTIVWYWASLPA